MSVATWPTTLPDELTHGYTEQQGSGYESFRTSKGPEKRRYVTDVPRDIRRTTLQLSGTQLGTLNTFFKTTLSMGTDPFDWTNGDPVDGSTVRYRFRRPPRVTHIIGNTTAADRRFAVTIELEII